MANDFKRGIRIYLETSDFGKGLEEMAASTKKYEEELAKLTKRAEEMTAAGTNSGKEWNKLQREKAKATSNAEKASKAELKMRQQLEETEKVLKNLSGATYRELLNMRTKLRSQMENSIRDGDKYKATQKQLIRVEKELTRAKKDLNKEIGCQGTLLGKAAMGLNKYATLITATIGAITGSIMGFRRLGEQVSQLDDIYSDVMKTTNLTREQVVALNEQFKKLDTRTSREELNKLAYEAGKLGLSAERDILGFVKASNVLKIAMGDVLGENAALQIGKMVGVYERSTRHLQALDLEGKMLSLGAAVNELGKTSTANEQYMVNFAGRLGGIAVQAGLTIDQVLGFASALDQDMQKVEMSATAFQKMIMNMFKAPEVFARAAKIPLEEFTELMRTDMNAAIKSVLRGFSGQGGLQQLIPMFQDMGLDGARAAAAISSMANSIEKVEDAQRIASQALIEGTSALDEYNIKNENLQAKLEKARKRFKEVSLELGESLYPVLIKLTKGTSHFMRALVDLIKWVKENKGLITALTVVMGLYTLAVSKAKIVELALVAAHKARVFWAKAVEVATLTQIIVTGRLTGATRVADLAMKQLNATLAMNPLVAVGVAVAALTVLIYRLITGKNKLTAAQKAMHDVTARVNSELERENINLEVYRKRLLQTDPNSQERIRLVRELNEKYPDLLKNIDAESASVATLNTTIKEYITNLSNTIRQKVLYSKITEKITQLESETSHKKRQRIRQEIDHLKKELEYQMLVNTYGERNAKLISQQEDLQRQQRVLEILVIPGEPDFDTFEKSWRQWNQDSGIFFSSGQAEIDELNKAFNEYVANAISAENDLKRVNAQLQQIDDILNGVSTTTTTTNNPTGDNPTGDNSELKKQQQRAIDNLLKNQQVLFDIERRAHINRLKAAGLFEVDLTLLTEEQLKIRLDLEEEHYRNLDRIAREAETERIRQAKIQIGVSGDMDAAPGQSGLSGDQLRAYEILYAQHHANLASIEEDGIKRRDDFVRNNDNIRLKALADSRDALLNVEAATQSALLAELQQGVIDRTKTQEDFNAEVEKLTRAGMENRLEILTSYRNMLLDIEGELTDEQIKAIQEANKAVTEIEKSIREKKLNDEIQFQNDRKNVILQYGLQNIAEAQRVELELLKQHYDQKLLSEKEFQQAKRAIQLKYAQEYVQSAQTLVNAGADAVQAIEQAQTARIGAEFAQRHADLQAQLDAGVLSQEDYNEQKAQLDYEQRVAELDIQKKYADANFALQVAQIGASTALTAMQAYSALAGIPVVGPALGVAAAIAAGITGAAQIAAAKAERDRVKSLTIEKPSTGGSSGSPSTGARVAVPQAMDGRYDVIGEQDGKTYRNVPYKGVMRTGMVTTPTLMGERGSEVVIDHPTLRNLQMNAPHIIDTIMRHRVPQRMEGNYTSLEPRAKSQEPRLQDGLSDHTVKELIVIMGLTKEILKRMEENGIDANVYLNELEAKIKLRDKSKQRGSLR